MTHIHSVREAEYPAWAPMPEYGDRLCHSNPAVQPCEAHWLKIANFVEKLVCVLSEA
jgi:hypothetical protein